MHELGQHGIDQLGPRVADRSGFGAGIQATVAGELPRVRIGDRQLEV